MGEQIIGSPLMPWQRQVLDVALELDADGHPAYRRVVLTVPRQSGKTTLQLALFVHRALAWGSPQVMVYAAQTGKDARKKLIEQPNGQIPMLQRSPFRHLFRPRLATGHEAVLWRNGSRHSLAANTEKSGHGDTLDLALLDEAFAHVDARLEQALAPAMATRRDAQLWVVSTAGSISSLYLRSKVDAGRQTWEDTDSGTAYFEWSADVAEPADDPDTWWGCMPALGITTTEWFVRSELASMRAEGNEDEFRRAYLNQWRDSSALDDVLAGWAAAEDRSAAPSGPLHFAVSMSDTGQDASIAVHGGDVVEIVEYRSAGGKWWLQSFWDELRSRNRMAGAWVAAGDPAADLGLPGVAVVRSADVTGACRQFAADINQGLLAHRGQDALNLAVSSAVRQLSGDGWRWSRRQSRADISPLWAATIARHGASGSRAPASEDDLLSSFG